MNQSFARRKTACNPLLTPVLINEFRKPAHFSPGHSLAGLCRLSHNDIEQVRVVTVPANLVIRSSADDRPHRYEKREKQGGVICFGLRPDELNELPRKTLERLRRERRRPFPAVWFTHASPRLRGQCFWKETPPSLPPDNQYNVQASRRRGRDARDASGARRQQRHPASLLPHAPSRFAALLNACFPSVLGTVP